MYDRSRYSVTQHRGICAGISDSIKQQVLHTCVADQYASEQDVLSDHTHHATWLPHGTEPCEFSGDHVSSSSGHDMMCDDSHSTSQPLTGRPVLAIAIGETYCPSKDSDCSEALSKLTDKAAQDSVLPLLRARGMVICMHGNVAARVGG